MSPFAYTVAGWLVSFCLVLELEARGFSLRELGERIGYRIGYALGRSGLWKPPSS